MVRQATEKMAIPAVLPSLKADLTELVHPTPFTLGGTVKDLRARLIAGRDEGGQTYDEANCVPSP